MTKKEAKQELSRLRNRYVAKTLSALGDRVGECEQITIKQFFTFIIRDVEDNIIDPIFDGEVMPPELCDE